MSKDVHSKEEAISQLYATIKTKFEEDGVLQDVRCQLQMKMIAMMKGKSTGNSLLQRPLTSTSNGQALINLLNQLIMEYYHWHGFHYSAEMFSMESSCENMPPKREKLEAVLGDFNHKEVPILIELIATLSKQQID